MQKVSLQDICNIGVRSNGRKFNKAARNFFIYLFCEYAFSINLNSETQIYRKIRSCLYENTIDNETLLKEIRKNDHVAEFIGLFPSSDDYDEWKNFLSETFWEYRGNNNIFTINGKQYQMPKAFLCLVEIESEFYAYKYYHDGQRSLFIPFESIISPSNELEDLETYDPFVCKIDKIVVSDFDTKVKEIELSEDDFFAIPTINESDSEQKSAICADIDRNIVVLAGAGSGKTRTLVNRALYLHLIKKIPLDRILLLTFTRNAADNMKRRGESIITPIYETYSDGNERPNLKTKTIDSFVIGLIKAYYTDMGFSQNPILKLDSSEQMKSEEKKWIADIIKEKNMEAVLADYLVRKEDEDMDFNYRYLLSDLEKYACGMLINHAGLESLLTEFVNRQIENYTVFGFTYCSYIVKEAMNNSSLPLKKIVEAQYDCIMIDEYQDINRLQNDIFEPLYNSGVHFTFVGDDDQSIYGWRGSDNAIIQKLVGSSKVDTYYLLTNYRNNPNIVKAGNEVLKYLSDRAKNDKEIIPHKKIGAKIRISTYDYRYQNIVNEIDKLIKEGGYKPEDISILVRNNTDKKIIREALYAADIPVTKEKITIEKKSNYNLLKSIISILNEYNVIGSCREIKNVIGIKDEIDGCEISDNYIRKIVTGSIDEVLLTGDTAISDLDDIKKELDRIRLLSKEIRTCKGRTLADIVYSYSLKAGELFEDCCDQHSDPVFEDFRLFCSNNNAPWPITRNRLKSLTSLYEENVRRDYSAGDFFEKGIKVGTIHSVKGLEYKVVIITGLNDGEYPNVKRINDEYETRCEQLNSLQKAGESYQKIKTRVSEKNKDGKNWYQIIVDACSNPLYDEIEEETLNCFRNDVCLIGARNIIGCTANGIRDYIESYKYYVIRLKNRYISKIDEYRKDAARYRDNIERIKDQIKLSKDANEEFVDAQTDLENCSKYYESARESVTRAERLYILFQMNIKPITLYYETCLQASGYLNDMAKSNDIDDMMKQLEKQMEKSKNEELRLFYVALTRAQDLLYLCNQEGSPLSPFMNYITDDIKENYTIFTKEDERDILRVKGLLRKEVEKDDISNELADGYTNDLVNNKNFKPYIVQRMREYYDSNPDYTNLPNESKVFFEKAMGLAFIGELTGFDIKPEFAHNIQRAAESLLAYLAGENAEEISVDDKELANKMVEDVCLITKCCNTACLKEKYVRGIIEKKSRFGDKLNNLKSAGIIHYIVRSGNYQIPKETEQTWKNNPILGNKEQFLIATTDLANTRNVLIHPSDKKWDEDPISSCLKLLRVLIQSYK